MKPLQFALVALFFLASSAHAHEIKIGKLVIHHPWIRQPVSSSMLAEGFTKIDNTGTEDDLLLKATAEGIPKVQIHDMKMQGDVMHMDEMAKGIPIPAGKSVDFKPKAAHIMLQGFKSAFIEGEVVKGTLTFAKAGTVAVDFEVVAPGGAAHVH